MGWDHVGWVGAAAGSRWGLVDVRVLWPRAKPGGHKKGEVAAKARSPFFQGHGSHFYSHLAPFWLGIDNYFHGRPPPRVNNFRVFLFRACMKELRSWTIGGHTIRVDIDIPSATEKATDVIVMGVSR